jgi:acetyl esterase/lipase
MVDLFATPSVYRIPELDDVEERTGLAFKQTPDGPLRLDVYGPTSARRPAVLIVYGDGPAEFLREARGWGMFRDLCRHLALRDIAGISFDHRSSRAVGIGEAASDVDGAVAFVRENANDLGVDPDRIALWTFSAGPPLALHTALRDRPRYIRALVVYYGILDLALVRHSDPAQRIVPDDLVAEYSPRTYAHRGADLPPMLIVRAGLDRPELNAGIDGFAAEAIAAGATIDLLAHPRGQHGFETKDDTDRSREIIVATLDFLTRRLRVV